MPTVLEALRRPWKLPKGFWLTTLILSIVVYIFSIDPSRVGSDAMLMRPLAVSVGLAVLIQWPILIALSVHLLRLKHKLGNPRFFVVLGILCAIGIACGSGGYEEHAAAVTMFIGSVVLLVIVPVTNWLFGVKRSAPNADNDAVVRAPVRSRWES